MKKIDTLLAKNREWSAQVQANDPTFFSELAKLQTPEYLWIGCSDSRVPANQIIGLKPGEIFVHRNVANVVAHSDLNCLSTIQFSVDVLKVKSIIVCGHYGCGGVLAALNNLRVGLADNWIRHVKDVAKKHSASIAKIKDEPERHARLCELNVIEQAINVCQSTVVQDAWARGQELNVHGLVYGLSDGLLRDLGMGMGNNDEMLALYDSALESLSN